eukprot:XP_015576940.1 uncharacterized protein LOC107261518 [Ricinus communis]
MVECDNAVSLIDNPSLPYYLHHTENYSFIIFSLEFTSMNFSSWKRSFVLAVSIRNKKGFLDGSIKKPLPEDSKYLAWICCNNLIVAWLFRSISSPIASTVFYMEEAAQIWEN